MPNMRAQTKSQTFLYHINILKNRTSLTTWFGQTWKKARPIIRSRKQNNIGFGNVRWIVWMWCVPLQLHPSSQNCLLATYSIVRVAFGCSREKALSHIILTIYILGFYMYSNVICRKEMTHVASECALQRQHESITMTSESSRNQSCGSHAGTR